MLPILENGIIALVDLVTGGYACAPLEGERILAHEMFSSPRESRDFRRCPNAAAGTLKRTADFPVCGVADFQIGRPRAKPASPKARAVHRLEAVRPSGLGGPRHIHHRPRAGRISVYCNAVLESGRVPQGRAKIAQHFSAGLEHAGTASPGGTTESLHQRLFRPSGTHSGRRVQPSTQVLGYFQSSRGTRPDS